MMNKWNSCRMTLTLFCSGRIANSIITKKKLFRTYYQKMLEQNRKKKKSRYFFIQYTGGNRGSIHILHISWEKIIEKQFDAILRSSLVHFMTFEILNIFHDIFFSTVFFQTSSTENFAVSFGFLLQCATVLAYTKLFPI